MGLSVLSGGKERKIHARLAELGPKANGKASGANRLSVTVEPLVSDMAPRLRLPSGIHGVKVVAVDPQGPGARAGIQANDVILEVNHQSVASAADLASALAKSASPVLLLIKRQGLTLFLAIELSSP